MRLSLVTLAGIPDSTATLTFSFFYSRQESLYMALIVSGFLQWQFDIAVICTCIDIILQYKNVLSLIFSGFSLYPQTVLYEGIHIWRLEDIIRFVVCL